MQECKGNSLNRSLLHLTSTVHIHAHLLLGNHCFSLGIVALPLLLFMGEMLWVFFHVACYPDSFSPLNIRLLPWLCWIYSWITSDSVKPHFFKSLSISTSYIVVFINLSNSWMVMFLIAYIQMFCLQTKVKLEKSLVKLEVKRSSSSRLELLQSTFIVIRSKQKIITILHEGKFLWRYLVLSS